MLCFYHNVKHNEYRIFHAKCSNNKLTFKGVCPWTKCLVVVKKGWFVCHVKWIVGDLSIYLQ
jgi:hypothetical protein